MSSHYKSLSVSVLVLATILGIFWPRILYADTQVCTEQAAYAAEQESDRLSTWDALYHSFKKYSYCDDGAISEGYSYTVVKLLTRHWSELGKLVNLVKSSNKFEEFVISHINETMSQSEADQVLRNISDRCPRGAIKLCERLRLAVQDYSIHENKEDGGK